MKRLLRGGSCILLCLILLVGTAFADTGPKESLTITVTNAPEGVYYLDLLHQNESGTSNVDLDDYDSSLVEGLRSWENEGWYPALVDGTNPPLFGDLVPGADGTHYFTYFGLPKTFRIAVSSSDGAQATSEPFTRTVFYTHLTYDWESNTITTATSPAGFYALQFLSTLVPTLLVEGVLLWLFGFRSKRDWLVFLFINLVTQAGLHLWIGTDLVSAGSHPMYYLVLVVAEIPILLVELIAYLFLLGEYGKGRRAAYAVCANLASYAAGYLPLHRMMEFLAQ